VEPRFGHNLFIGCPFLRHEVVMFIRFRLAVLPLAFLAATVVPGCSFDQRRADDYYGPKPEEMRSALKNLLKERTDINIPEFQMSLDYDEPVFRDGIVHLGVWNCDPRLMTFEGLFSTPNITMYEVSGRFEMAARGVWVAIPRRVLETSKREVGEFWRPNEIEPR
jgi:hypothetical protein